MPYVYFINWVKHYLVLCTNLNVFGISGDQIGEYKHLQSPQVHGSYTQKKSRFDRKSNFKVLCVKF